MPKRLNDCRHSRLSTRMRWVRSFSDLSDRFGHRDVEPFMVRSHHTNALLVTFRQLRVDAADADVPGIQRSGPLFGRPQPIIAKVVSHGPAPKPRAPRPVRVANSELSTILLEFSSQLNHLSETGEIGRNSPIATRGIPRVSCGPDRRNLKPRTVSIVRSTIPGVLASGLTALIVYGHERRRH